MVKSIENSPVHERATRLSRKRLALDASGVPGDEYVMVALGNVSPLPEFESCPRHRPSLRLIEDPLLSTHAWIISNFCSKSRCCSRTCAAICKCLAPRFRNCSLRRIGAKSVRHVWVWNVCLSCNLPAPEPHRICREPTFGSRGHQHDSP